MKAGKGNTNKYRTRAVLLFMLTVCLIMSGCGKKAQEAPELLDPSKDTTAFRPVSKHLVGYLRTLYGKVVPREYCVYSEKGIAITSVNVGLGDYVKEGDVVAVSDPTGSDEQAREITFRIAGLEREREKTARIYDQTFGLIDYEKETEAMLEGGEMAQILKEEQIQGENRRHELAVIESNLEAERSALSDIKKKEGRKEFTAPHSGRVSYIMDLSAGNVAGAYENIVVISDESDLYVEAPEVNIEKYEYGDYQSKWTVIDGEKIPISEMPYTSAESTYAYAAKKNPGMRFNVPSDKLKIGDDLVLYFMDAGTEETLAVGNDSLFREGMDAFVYVKVDETGKTEKRQVETGNADADYTEIKSGLAEGEALLYSNKTVLPVKYEEYTVESKCYNEEVKLDKLSIARGRTDIYTAGSSGNFKRSKEPGNVKAGEQLFTISSVGGKADVEAAAISIDDLNTNHNLYLKEYEKNKKELTRALDAASENQAVIGKRSDITPEEEDIDATRSMMNGPAQIRSQLNILEIEKEYEQKEYEASKAKLTEDYNRMKSRPAGSGESSGAALHDGYFSNFAVDNDKAVSKGDFLVSLECFDESGANTRLYAYEPPKSLGDDVPAPLGGKVTLVCKDKQVTGKCIAKNPWEERYYLFTRDGKQAVTNSKPYPKSPIDQFYVELDEKIDEEMLSGATLLYNRASFPGAVIVPARSVHSEVNMFSGEEKFFVWKLIGNEPVKEFITLYQTDAATEYMMVLRGVSLGDIILE
ncbi:MAG: efflux RND transporter periplasmic adaptor subunit [Lachnospiraceae bacterium]|nr:efflux RND transporter periplasmic adaptor subunit [Lachnospiraceae bacterium]